MASVTFKQLNKVYDGKVQALKDIDLKVNAQDFLVIVGPSGCGKTTLLMILAGLERETSGEVWIDDTCVNNVDPKDRDVAVVFQSYALYPHMTVFGNMAFSLKVRRKKKDFINRKVAEVAEMLNLTEYLKRKPHQLSGGQKQRVAIGRAIVREPKVFLFDEPLSNLDIALRNKMRDELKKLHSELGATIVYVTHDQVEAMTLATTIVVLNEGEIQQVGTPFEIFMRPKTRFVASFIGSPLFSGGTTSGESQIRKWMLDNDYIEAIIALPTDMFYNTGIATYAWILSKNKRKERKDKIQLINAAGFFKPLRKPLGKKRRELAPNDIKRTVKIYGDFKEGEFCKIFHKNEFLYREYTVWQPLQRTGRINAETVEAIASSALFTADKTFYDEALHEALAVKEPRTDKEDVQLAKLEKGKIRVDAIIATLKKNLDAVEYKDYAAFIKRLQVLLGSIDGLSAKAIEKIAYAMSDMDKTAVVQKDKKAKTSKTTSSGLMAHFLFYSIVEFKSY